jgi:hypothetical protein
MRQKSSKQQLLEKLAILLLMLQGLRQKQQEQLYRIQGLEQLLALLLELVL